MIVAILKLWVYKTNPTPEKGIRNKWEKRRRRRRSTKRRFQRREIL